MIILKNATINLQDQAVLEAINLEIKQGELVYLVGLIGSGKTSFLKMLRGELPFSGNEGLVERFNLKALLPQQVPLLRRSLGMVFQDFKLLDDRSVYKNLVFALQATGWHKRKEIEKRINQVLVQTNTNAQNLKAMPHELSGGEKQQLTIVRALLNDPPILLADEPTGNLDMATAQNIMQLLVHLNQQQHKTVIVATHNLWILEQFPGRILWVHNKQIEEVGITALKKYFNFT